jgi:hypothetical protein
LEPPSSCNWKTKEVGASNECNSSRHIRCWKIWQEGVCFSLMERIEGGAEGSEWRLKLRRVNE